MFSANCLPILIGSLPVTDHLEATKLILSRTPQIPLWPQLPKNPGEGMVRQFLSGFPGLKEEGTRLVIENQSASFEEEMVLFYEDYMAVQENEETIEHSRFALGDDTAPGFSIFVEEASKIDCVTLKGQITGPMTTGIGVVDQNGRNIFYDENLRDMLVKHLALKGAWQVRKLSPFTGGNPPIIFIDEPGMVSFGSSAFLGISADMVTEAVGEVIETIQAAGGLAGVHICANGDWGPVLSSDADIISFDAYFFFENFILYREKLVSFLERGGLLAWGIVPTGDPGVLEKIDGDELFVKWQEQVDVVSGFGINEKKLKEQTLIAPSCGTGSLTFENSIKVLELTAYLSARARSTL